jgi:hypothetical protein
MAEFEHTIEGGSTPWGLWWNMAAGLIAWGLDLGLSYVLEQHSCSTGHYYVLHTISAVCFVIALSGVAAGFREMKRFPQNAKKEEGGSHFNRAYFQVILGMLLSASFAVVIVAGALPRWILSPCE